MVEIALKSDKRFLSEPVRGYITLTIEFHDFVFL